MAKVFYLCDGKKGCGYEHGPFCGVYNTVVVSGGYMETSTYDLCVYTTNPSHARNGGCEDPENHPERFVIFNNDYWEKEEPNA